jgi:hypothetical protein
MKHWTNLTIATAAKLGTSKLRSHHSSPKPESTSPIIPRDKGATRPLEIALLAAFAASWLWLALLGISNHEKVRSLEAQLAKYRADTVTEHHVVVIGRLDNGDWKMRSDEEPSIVFRPCPTDMANGVDVDGILTPAIGWVADHAVWEERGTCKSILRADLGFWFPDENFKYTRALR